MALYDQIKAYVDAGIPCRDRHIRGQETDKLFRGGNCFLAGDGTLCVKAHAAASANLSDPTAGASSLPTRLTGEAYALVPVLRELIDRGVLTGSGLELHDDPTKGVTLEEEDA